MIKETSERHAQSIQEISDRQSRDMEEVRKMLVGLQTSLSSPFPLVFSANPNMAELKNLKQIRTIQEYVDSFDALLNRVALSEEYTINCFLSGLKEEIQLPMRMFAPTTLQKALSLARLQESTIESNNKRNRNIRPNSSYSLVLLPTPKGSSTSVLPQGPSLSPVLPPGPSLPSKPPEATLNRSWPQK
uniref:Ty3 transposon capsid-like protein domain-containing protein n=1 Tax=Ananas comosus var. bracteatus TaxID=296719 RepID=A0A6V7Q792_ANACO|nr:unnamed protein product [Ananas comosus var. bracteatus]